MYQLLIIAYLFTFFTQQEVFPDWPVQGTRVSAEDGGKNDDHSVTLNYQFNVENTQACRQKIVGSVFTGDVVVETFGVFTVICRNVCQTKFQTDPN